MLGVMDGQSYGVYKRIKGSWEGEEATVVVDHVQGDPFATPSRLRLRIPASIHGFPLQVRETKRRRVALADYVLRQFAHAARKHGGRSGSGKSGDVIVDDGDAEILARSGCGFVDDAFELRFRVGLPARGRRILGRAAAALLGESLLHAAREIHWSALDHDGAWAWIKALEDHDRLQAQLAERDLVAFVPDGAILPRESGISSRPLKDAVPFASPPELAVELQTQHHGPVTGMGVPAGVTLITGGGYHGKTTLLEAIQDGIYPHIPGDGRERVVTRADALKVRSEDGRSVQGVNLSSFIHDLPGKRSTDFFSTPDASGSTSLAAAILEGLEVGARVLLLDEDTSATNLLIRDARMQALVARETIIPLIDRVQEIKRERDVSTILVVGGSGDYLEVADTVILMQDYLPREVSGRAAEVVMAHPTGRETSRGIEALAITARRPAVSSLDPTRARRSKVRARGLRELQYGENTIDLSSLEQLVDDSQARAIGVLMAWIGRNGSEGHTLGELIDDVLEVADRRGLYDLDPLPELAAVRRFELAGAVNRLRALRVSRPEC